MVENSVSEWSVTPRTPNINNEQRNVFIYLLCYIKEDMKLWQICHWIWNLLYQWLTMTSFMVFIVLKGSIAMHAPLFPCQIRQNLQWQQMWSLSWTWNTIICSILSRHWSALCKSVKAVSMYFTFYKSCLSRSKYPQWAVFNKALNGAHCFQRILVMALLRQMVDPLGCKYQRTRGSKECEEAQRNARGTKVVDGSRTKW